MVETIVVPNTAILVVDDEVSLRNTFSIFLRREGYQTVMAVGSFEEAVAAVSSQLFDLIICDIVLENQSGIALLERFRQLGVECPVVMVTGYPQIETASDAVRLGAFDYLAKPVEKEALLKTARLAIQQYRLEKGKREAERAEERYRHFLETIFKSVSDSIISVDPELTVQKANCAASLLFNDQPALGEGGNLNSLRPNKELCQLADSVAKVLETGLELGDHRVECTLGNKNKVLSICISPLDNGLGNPGGAVLVVRDMTYEEQQNRHHRTRFH